MVNKLLQDYLLNVTFSFFEPTVPMVTMATGDGAGTSASSNVV